MITRPPVIVMLLTTPVVTYSYMEGFTPCRSACRIIGEDFTTINNNKQLQGRAENGDASYFAAAATPLSSVCCGDKRYG
ncbi:hypothetical protein HDV57DRAFT_497878 [Trichoderma longibrachiatum]